MNKMLVLLAWCCLFGRVLAADFPAKPLPLQLLKKPPANAAELMRLLPPTAQDADAAQYYRIDPRRHGDDSLYVLQRAALWLAQLQPQADGNWRLVRFGDYRGLLAPGDIADGGERQDELHPALYPLSASQAAVAVVAAERNYFSGGGSFYQVADFYTLPEVGQKPVLVSPYRQVPFYRSELYRACFSEREYRTSPHCHDEHQGVLHVNIRARAQHSAYVWQLLWLTTDWPAHKPQKQQSRESKRWYPGMRIRTPAP